MDSARLRQDTAADNDRGSADSASSSSFAATARELQHGGMKEKPATKTKKPTQPPLVGQAANSTLKTVVTKRDIDLFVSRLHPSTQISEMRDCVADILREQTGDKTECFKLQSRHKELYSSYHVKVILECGPMPSVMVAVTYCGLADHDSTFAIWTAEQHLRDRCGLRDRT